MTHQPALFPQATSAGAGPVECLGLTFETDAARRAYFTEKLQNLEFCPVEQFLLARK